MRLEEAEEGEGGDGEQQLGRAPGQGRSLSLLVGLICGKMWALGPPGPNTGTSPLPLGQVQAAGGRDMSP